MKCFNTSDRNVGNNCVDCLNEFNSIANQFQHLGESSHGICFDVIDQVKSGRVDEINIKNKEFNQIESFGSSFSFRLDSLIRPVKFGTMKNIARAIPLVQTPLNGPWSLYFCAYSRWEFSVDIFSLENIASAKTMPNMRIRTMEQLRHQFTRRNAPQKRKCRTYFFFFKLESNSYDFFGRHLGVAEWNSEIEHS